MLKLTKDRDFYRTMLLVALPAALQSLIAQLVNMADELMVSWSFDRAAVAGMLQANSVTNLYVMTVAGLVSGSAVLIAQYWGKRDMERIRQVFTIVMLWVAALSVLVTALVFAFPGAIMGWATNDPSVIAGAVPYLQMLCLSFVPFALSQALIGMLRSVEVVKISLWISIGSVFVDVALNALFIFGIGPFPAMGARGAALTTVMTRFLELFVVGFYALRVQKVVPLRARDLFKVERFLWGDYGRYGVPVGLGDMQWALIGLFKALIIGHVGGQIMGNVVITSYGMAERMLSLGMLFCFALANGACIVIGKTVGAGDYDKTREYSRSIQILFLIFGVFFAGVVYLTRGLFVGLYRQTPEITQMAVSMVALGAPTMIGTCYHASCFVGINRGAGDSRFVMYVDMICGWLIVLPIAYFAAFVWRVPYAYMFLFLRIDQCFKWIVAFIRLRGNKWIKNVTRA